MEELPLRIISKRYCGLSTELLATRTTDMNKTQFHPFENSQLRLAKNLEILKN